MYVQTMEEIATPVCALVRNDRLGDCAFAMTGVGMADSRQHNYSHFLRVPFPGPAFLFVESAVGCIWAAHNFSFLSTLTNLSSKFTAI